MKVFYLFTALLFIISANYAQNINYILEIERLEMDGCDDGLGSDEEPTWKVWAQDNDQIPTWVGGFCHAKDDNIPILYSPSSNIDLISVTNSTVTQFEVRVDAWEDDDISNSPGPPAASNRCSFDDGFFDPGDDDREEHTFAPINLRDSVSCQWHTISYNQGCFTWKIRFKWEYTVFDAGPLTSTFCGDSAVLSAQGSGQWSIVSGGSGGFIDVTDPTTTFGGVSGNNYSLQWESLPDCETFFSDDIDVILNLNPEPNLTASTTTFCDQGEIDWLASNGTNYEWAINDITNVIGNTTSGQFTSNVVIGDDIFYVTSSNSVTNCSSVDSIQLSVLPSPNIDLGNDTTICFGAQIDLDITEPFGVIAGYSWNTGSTQSILTINSPAQYIGIVTHPNLCSDSDTIEVSYYPEIPLDLGNDTTMCIGETITLDAGAGFLIYQWHNGPGIQTNDIVNFGNYYVTVTDGNNCTETDSILVSPNYFTYSLGADTTISFGATINLEANPGVSYSWTNGDTTQIISITPDEDTEYIATTLLNNGCFEVGTINVLVNEELNVFIPNMFSPNNDGSNDNFLVYGFGIQDVDFAIFNRWGKLVYETKDLTELQATGWDGKFNGEDQPTGTYVWRLTGTSILGDPITINNTNQGSILLRR